VWQHNLHGVQRALDIEVEGLVEQIVVNLEKFRAPDGGAGGIEQEMHAAETVERELDHVLDGSAFGDVDGERQRLGAKRINLLGRLLDALFVDVGANHVGTLAGEDQCGGAADAAAGPRNDDGFTVKIVRRFRHGDCPLECHGRAGRNSSWIAGSTPAMTISRPRSWRMKELPDACTDRIRRSVRRSARGL
jgi:hypothetical protein